MENAISNEILELSEDSLKEIFALSSSSTDYEVELAYDPRNEDFWQKENLDEAYKQSQEKREYVYDSLRGVLGWLSRHGYQIVHEGKEVDMSKILGVLVQKSEEE